MGMNEKLGLPFDKMKKITIAFDVDGTLIDENDNVNERIRSILVGLASFKNVKIVVWSGGGELWARQVGNRIGIDNYVDRYASKMEWQEIQPDIAIDDIQDTAIGKINLIVKEK